jgi:hypothetical protein
VGGRGLSRLYRVVEMCFAKDVRTYLAMDADVRSVGDDLIWYNCRKVVGLNSRPHEHI